MFSANIFLCFVALIYGSFIGSFIIRFPKMVDKDSEVSIYSPRSRCEECKKSLKFLMLIPLISFLYQRGKCSFCKKPINNFYLNNEFLHLFLMAMILWLNPSDGSLYSVIQNMSFFLVLSSLYAQFILDLKHLSLSVFLSMMILMLGLILNLYFDFFVDTVSAFIGIAIGYGTLYLIDKIYYLIRKHNAIGGGDFILLASIGALFGYQMLSVIILLGSLFGLLIYLIYKSDYLGKVPLGSGIALSAFLVMIIGIIF